MTDHPRLTRYIPSCIGTAYAGMSKERAPGLYGPEWDPTHGPYVLASEADAEIDRLRAEVERLRQNDPAVILAELWSSCRVVFYPEAGDLRGDYPIEHAPGAGKDSRQLIEARLAERVLHRARCCPTCGCGR